MLQRIADESVVTGQVAGRITLAGLLSRLQTKNILVYAGNDRSDFTALYAGIHNMYCSGCGAKNGEGVRFCRQCGRQLAGSSQWSAEDADPYKTRLAIPVEAADLKKSMEAQKPPATPAPPDP